LGWSTVKAVNDINVRSRHAFKRPALVFAVFEIAFFMLRQAFAKILRD
jgi:hypothetical protein